MGDRPTPMDTSRSWRKRTSSGLQRSGLPEFGILKDIWTSLLPDEQQQHRLMADKSLGMQKRFDLGYTLILKLYQRQRDLEAVVEDLEARIEILDLHKDILQGASNVYQNFAKIFMEGMQRLQKMNSGL